MKQTFFSDKYLQALARSYLVPCMLWGEEDEEFYNKNILPSFRRFMRDLLPKLKKCDSRVNTALNEILITCANRETFTFPGENHVEIGAVITQKKIIPGVPVVGMAFGFTSKKILLAGGIFGLGNDMFPYVKEYTMLEDEKLSAIISNEEFSEIFTDIECFPPCTTISCEGIQVDSENGFIGCHRELPGRFITDDILAEIIIGHYKAIKLMNRLLSRPLKATLVAA